MKQFFLRVIYRILRPQIEAIVKDRLKEVVLDEYISREMDYSKLSKGELQFKGKVFIKMMAASFHEILGDAENYVSMDLQYEGEKMNIILQRVAPGKMTPHGKAVLYENKYKNLKKGVEDIIKICEDIGAKNDEGL